MKLLRLKSKKWIGVAYIAIPFILLGVTILFDVELPSLCCKQWIQPFLTVSALLVAILSLWIQFWLQHWARGDIAKQSITSFPTTLVTTWIYLAMLFSLIALVLAVYSCSEHGYYICPGAVSCAATSLFMTFLLVIYHFVGNIIWIVRSKPGEIPGSPIIEIKSTKDKCYWFLIFWLVVIGLFLVSLRITGIF